MEVGYERPEFHVDEPSRTIDTRFKIVNRTDHSWNPDDGFAIGWQIFDPDTGTFIAEGEWQSFAKELAPAETAQVNVRVKLPPERGRYHVYLSPVHQDTGWLYLRGNPFLLLDALVEGGSARLIETSITTLGKLRRRNLASAARRMLTHPVLAIWRNRGLVRSMVRRDILARYRGSFGDVLWTVLHPVLLMATYFFVFGIVLESRFGQDNSRTGFVLYFLAGMLPWLAFSEAIGRAPSVILEHRNFVKKLVFPVEILPVTQVVAGLVTQAFATGIFLVVLLLIRNGIPASVLWLPFLLIPQLLFTLGLAWFLSALGVYVRDLGQMIGFLLTLWFFLTPICYPEASLPQAAADILTKNPVYVLVRGYRDIFLEGRAPDPGPLWKLSLLSLASFLLGHAWFYKLRKSFADVI
jgi:lipopolysaccharide transport system permease protein